MTAGGHVPMGPYMRLYLSKCVCLCDCVPLRMCLCSSVAEGAESMLPGAGAAGEGEIALCSSSASLLNHLREPPESPPGGRPRGRLPGRELGSRALSGVRTGSPIHVNSLPFLILALALACCYFSLTDLSWIRDLAVPASVPRQPPAFPTQSFPEAGPS